MTERISFLVILTGGFVLTNTLPMTWIPLLLYAGILWILGIILWMWKYQGSYTGWWLGTTYWLLMGWKGDDIRQYLHQVASQYWNGDGTVNWLLITLAVTVLYAAAGIKMCHRFAVSFPTGMQTSIGSLTKKTKQVMGQDWELIEFQLGTDRTSEVANEPFRPGGE